MDMQADNQVTNPTFSGNPGGPDGWKPVFPRPELSPKFGVGSGSNRLVIASTGDKYAIGCWQGDVRLEAGDWYRASVRVRMTGVADPELSVFAQVSGHFLVPKERTGDEILLEQTFRHTDDQPDQKIELFLRAAETGEIEWFEPCVVKVPQPEHRMARVATVRFGQTVSPISLAEQRARIASKLDDAGALKPDIVCLTEVAPIVGVDEKEYKTWPNVAEEVPDGPVCRILSEKARMHKMYVIGGIVERRGGYVFNTAVIFDREGKFLGRYAKTHLTFWEIREGISCGDDYPVFDLDFGRIAIHICYDEWFPEVARYYAHAGAEILFLPVAGGKPITWRTRALDNRVYFISSSWTPPSMIIDSSGAIVAETHGDGVAVADLNLDYRETNVYRDPTLSCGMPCIFQQMRNVVDNDLLDRLSRSMK